MIPSRSDRSRQSCARGDAKIGRLRIPERMAPATRAAFSSRMELLAGASWGGSGDSDVGTDNLSLDGEIDTADDGVEIVGAADLIAMPPIALWP